MQQHLVGLNNVGNTCGVNTLIQCIFHCSRIRQCLLATEKFTDGILCNETRHLMRRMAIETSAFTPDGLLCVFRKLFANLENLQIGHQLDVHELYLVWLDHMARELVHTSRSMIKRETKGVLTRFQKKAIETWNGFSGKLPDIWKFTFEGLLVHQIVCSKCQHVSHTFEPFSVLSIEQNVTIEKAIWSSIKTEKIKWHCEKCRKTTSAQRLIRFWKLPDVWILQLKRFHGSNLQKDTFGIDIPVFLNLHANVELAPPSPPQCSPEKSYRLTSIANHVGSLYGGHYTATVFPHPKQPLRGYHVNDSRIHEIPDVAQELKKNESAYLLFYECVN